MDCFGIGFRLEVCVNAEMRHSFSGKTSHSLAPEIKVWSDSLNACRQAVSCHRGAFITQVSTSLYARLCQHAGSPKNFCATAASVSDRAPPYRGAKPLVITPSRSCFPLHLVSSHGYTPSQLSCFTPQSYYLSVVCQWQVCAPRSSVLRFVAERLSPLSFIHSAALWGQCKTKNN